VTRHRLLRTFWTGAAAILVAAALIGLVAVLKGDFSDTDGRILGTLAAMLFTGGGLLSGLTLVERGPARPLGWAEAAVAPVCLALLILPIWDIGPGEESGWRPAWSAVITVVAGLVATTGLVLARGRVLARLAAAAGALAGVAAALSIAGIWTEADEPGLVKAIVALWILTALAFFLVPVLGRWSTVGREPEVRVLASLGDVELVAARGHVEGVPVPGRPADGERLVLRHRAPPAG
jgi:hypothetical protein